MERSRVRLTALFEWGLGLVGLAIGLIIGFLHFPHLVHVNPLILISIFGSAVLLDSIPVPLGKASGSLLIALPMGVMVLYDSALAIWAMIVAGFGAALVRRQRSKWSTTMFNAGQYAISTYAMVSVYVRFDQGISFSMVEWGTVLGLVLGWATFVFFNHLFIHVLYVFRGTFDKSDILKLLREDAILVLIAFPMAILMILITPQQPVVGALVMLPVALLGQVVRMYRKMSYMGQVHEAVLALTAEFDVDHICFEAAKTAAKLTYASYVTVHLLDSSGSVLKPAGIYPSAAKRRVNAAGVSLEQGGVVWSVIRSSGHAYVPDTRKDPRVIQDGANTDEEARSMAIFPLYSRGTAKGALVCFSDRPYAFNELTDNIGTLAAQVSILIDNAQLYQTLQEQSSKDGATGLFNYRYFYEALARRVEDALRFQKPVSVSVIDIDYFKKFNDTYGHLAGDAVLRSIGELLVRLAGPSAVVARYGGEEFGIIWPYGPEETFARVEQIRADISRHVVDFDEYRLQGITVSSGVASIHDHSMDDRDLLLKADSAMYWGAKQRGRNRTALYAPEFDAQLFVDQVTGLYTYHFLTIRAREEIEQGTHNWGVVCIDLVNFSFVNSTFGFAVGDSFLKDTSLLIKDSLRLSELACRFAGDEFLVLLPGVTVVEAESVAQRIVKAISTYGFEGDTDVIVSMRARYLVGAYSQLEDAADLLDHVGTLFAQLNAISDEHLA